MTPSKVELINRNNQYQMLVNGQDFYIKGAGVDLGSVKSLAEYGGNAFRTWRVDNGERTALEILNEAQEHGLMVCMGIEVARERHGFDYNDKQAVAHQKAQIRKDVMALKDHPALLMWGIGNELNLRHTNPKVWDAVNELSEMIHDIDPNHPTSTMLAGAEPEVIQLVAKRSPDLDLLSFQLYGDIDKLPQYLADSAYTGAYTVSEWGATGHWESPCTDWGRPIEANSSDKANAYKTRYLNYIAADTAQCVGSFVFLWGQKQERTPTWYGVFLENGRHTEAAQTMYQLWTSEDCDNPVPKHPLLTLEGAEAISSVRLTEGSTYSAQVNCQVTGNQPISYRWELMKEVKKSQESDGGDFEPTPDIVWHQSQSDKLQRVEFEAPEAGEYRLFVYLDDGFGGSATANMPILVES
jgi:hypothetical protein